MYYFYFSSGYGSLPGSTRNSVIDTSLPPVPGQCGSDSDIVQKSSPDTSPLAAKKCNGVSGYRQSREESNSWVCFFTLVTKLLYNIASRYLGIHAIKQV